MPSGRPKRHQPSEADRTRLTLDLEALASMNLDAMRALWRQRISKPYPPKLKSPEIFRGLLGYKLREQVEGSLSSAARRKLAEIERKAKTGEKVDLLPRLNVGVRLEREYRGVLHEVDVVEGGFRHQDTVYSSLSEVARAITGARWSGPRFFGLKGASPKAHQ
jgi:hypothetical protein